MWGKDAMRDKSSATLSNWLGYWLSNAGRILPFYFEKERPSSFFKVWQREITFLSLFGVTISEILYGRLLQLVHEDIPLFIMHHDLQFFWQSCKTYRTQLAAWLSTVQHRSWIQRNFITITRRRVITQFIKLIMRDSELDTTRCWSFGKFSRKSDKSCSPSWTTLAGSMCRQNFAYIVRTKHRCDISSGDQPYQLEEEWSRIDESKWRSRYLKDIHRGWSTGTWLSLLLV